MLKYTCRAGTGWGGVINRGARGSIFGVRGPGPGPCTRVPRPRPGSLAPGSQRTPKNGAVSTAIHHPTPRRPALHVYLKK